ncbi:MAG: dicarboxylate/amino acid:cation symporter [Verrucomicrobia bacterium]|nr:dicarboxylate/amino acid:cation symporter [Verrucomicrobiota bacterium]
MSGGADNRSQAARILAGLVLGLALGLAAGAFLPEASQPSLNWWIDQVIQPAGRIFLRIIFMVVVPLILSAIVLGTLEMGDIRTLGRIGIRTLVTTIFLSAAGVGIALGLVNVLEPGHSLPEEKREALIASYGGASEKSIERGSRPQSISTTLLNFIPENPLTEAVNAFNPENSGGGLLALMVFSLFVGVAMAVAKPEKTAVLKGFFEGMFEVCMTIIGFALKLAPFGVACLGFAVAARLGLDLFTTLGAYVGVVLLGLGLQQFVVYPLALRFFANRSPWEFFKQSREAIVTAFSTSSSNATLPVSLRVAEQNLGIPTRIGRFVLTVGASANQNGTALYEGVTVLFLAQVFGVELNLGQQLVVALMCVMAGIGTAGVPGGSLPLVVGVLLTIGVPADAIAIILGIDRFLDMCRTTLNVTGDLVVAAVVSKPECAS